MLHKIVQYLSKLEVMVPLNVIPWSIMLSSVSFNSTLIVAALLVIISCITYKYLIEIMPKFFLHCVILWIIANYAIYEFVCVDTLMIYPDENRTTSLLMAAACFCIYQVKRKVWKFKNIILGANKPSDFVKYCSYCEIYTPADTRHKFWINCCIIPTNKLYYTSGLVFGFFTLLYTSNLILITLCEPVRLFAHFYLPRSCPGVYFTTELSLSFVSAIYQTMFSLFILLEILTMLITKICCRGRK